MKKLLFILAAVLVIFAGVKSQDKQVFDKGYYLQIVIGDGDTMEIGKDDIDVRQIGNNVYLAFDYGGKQIDIKLNADNYIGFSTADSLRRALRKMFPQILNAYDKSIGGIQNMPMHGGWAHYTSPEILANTTDETLDSTFYVLYMESYKFANLDINVSGGVTVTVWVTNDASLSNSTMANYYNWSTVVLGGASIVDTHGFYSIQNRSPLKILIRCVNSDDTNVIKIIAKKYY